jgi:hypothetical protein
MSPMQWPAGSHVAAEAIASSNERWRMKRATPIVERALSDYA